MPENGLITAWLQEFGDSPVRPRDVVEFALSDSGSARLREAIVDAIPELGWHPHPKLLINWLKRNENRPIENGSGLYRFSPLGHRWRVLPALKRVLILAD